MDSRTLSLFTDNNLIQFVVIPVLITLIFSIVLYLFSFKQTSDIRPAKSNKIQQNKSGTTTTTNKKKHAAAEKSEGKQPKHVKDYVVAKNDIPKKTEVATKSVSKTVQATKQTTKLNSSKEKLLKSKANAANRLNSKNQKVISNDAPKKLSNVEKSVKKIKSEEADGWQVVQSKTDKKSVLKKPIKEIPGLKIEIQNDLSAAANLKNNSAILKNQKQFKNELNRIQKTKTKIQHSQLKSMDPTIQLVEDIPNTTITINSDNGSTFEMPKHITKDELEKIVKQISAESNSKGTSDKTVTKIIHKTSNQLNDEAANKQFGTNLLAAEKMLRQEAELLLDHERFDSNYDSKLNGGIVKKPRNQIGAKTGITSFVMEEKLDSASQDNVAFDEMADVWITAKPQKKKH